jgi:hypothetical protein
MMKIYEMTSAEDQLELLQMIMACAWSNIAQQAQQQKTAAKKTKPVTKRRTVKPVAKQPQLPTPKPLNAPLSTPQVANTARTSDAQTLQYQQARTQ